MSNSASSDGMPLMIRQSWFSSPELGAASISQAMAPTKGGVTSEAMTRVRIVRASGMSVRGHQPAERRRDETADHTHRAGDDQGRDQRIDETWNR